MGCIKAKGKPQQQRCKTVDLNGLIQKMAMEQAMQAWVKLEAGHTTAVDGQFGPKQRKALLGRMLAILKAAGKEHGEGFEAERARLVQLEQEKMAAEAEALEKAMAPVVEPNRTQGVVGKVPGRPNMVRIVSLNWGDCFTRTWAHQMAELFPERFRVMYKQLSGGEELPPGYLDFANVR